MPRENKAKSLCVNDLRHAEYYGMQNVFDELYAKSQRNEEFCDLMSIILSQENIMLAYRNIKTNAGSNTPGTDRLTITDIGRLTPEEMVAKVRFIIQGSKHGYRPKPVRRKDIPKQSGGTRPLGIPCIWDRLIQQCIKQVMEPICEAKFSENSYGFRPNRSVENAIARSERLIQIVNLHYVVEFDIKGFFDNVNHSKLIKQIWSMNIHDKHLLYVIKQMLKAPIRMPNGTMVAPTKGTPQGGILSPLLANIVLNELDQWVDSQWEENPIAYRYAVGKNVSGSPIKSSGYRAMRGTKLKEMYIVRYADDFRIYCRTQDEAERTLIAVKQWLSKRLKLELSPDKTRVVNVKNRYMEFLGFKTKLQRKGNKYVIKSHINDKQMTRIRKQLVEQAKRIAQPRSERKEIGEILLYDSMVMGIQNYYHIASEISHDCSTLNRAAMTTLTNRLRTPRGNRLVKNGRNLTDMERRRYGQSAALRFVAGTDEPIYPISYVQYKAPISKKRKICKYTEDGRRDIHDNLAINKSLMLKLMRSIEGRNSIEYTDNRISLYSAQFGRCAVTGIEFSSTEDIHCHHKKPRSKGGSDKYENLILVLDTVHKLIHAVNEETVDYYKNALNATPEQIKRINELRKIAGYDEIA